MLKRKLNIFSRNIVLFSFFLQPFYIWKSGLPQIGHILLIISLILFTITTEYKFRMRKIDNKIIIFAFFVIIINLGNFYFENDSEFILSTLMYIYNIVLILLIRNIIAVDYKFLNILKNILVINLVLQLIIFIVGIGRVFQYVPIYRYMGTFNDPNQLGFYVFSLLLILNVIYTKISKTMPFYIDLMVISLVALSASTSIFLGMVSYYLIKFTMWYFRLNRKYKFIFIAVISITTAITIDFVDFTNPNIPMIERVLIKLEKFDNNYGETTYYANLTIIEERGIDRLLYNPLIILYGSGQGGYGRFESAIIGQEIHSTLPSILFYYGIIPFILFGLWVKENIQNIDLKNIIIIFPLILESFFLLNERQFNFWFIIILLGYLNEQKNTL